MTSRKALVRALVFGISMTVLGVSTLHAKTVPTPHKIAEKVAEKILNKIIKVPKGELSDSTLSGKAHKKLIRDRAYRKWQRDNADKLRMPSRSKVTIPDPRPKIRPRRVFDPTDRV